ncbi:MAG TPA: NAD(P)H-dependent oxidoreductase subunit E [Acidobacteriota bacterium]|nr:NAD(P)H-dependent oxidoreductase subunit E [Acidobacteriota bacterium]
MTSVPGFDHLIDQKVAAIVGRYEAQPTALIMVLQDIQRSFRYLPEEALHLVARRMQLPLSRVYSVATYYRAFSLNPKGRHHVCVCTGTACHVRGARQIVEKLERDLRIKPGETTPDMEYSLDTVNCLGACALGPLVLADDMYYGNMTNADVDRMLKRLSKSDKEHRAAKEAA